MTNLFTPLARSVAIASLAGVALITGSFGPVAAQTPPDNKPPAAAAATSSKPETVEQRITQLKAALKITPDQESKWNSVAQAMRDNAASLEKLLGANRAIAPASMTAVDEFKTYSEVTQGRLDG